MSESVLPFSGCPATPDYSIDELQPFQIGELTLQLQAARHDKYLGRPECAFCLQCQVCHLGNDAVKLKAIVRSLPCRFVL